MNANSDDKPGHVDEQPEPFEEVNPHVVAYGNLVVSFSALSSRVKLLSREGSSLAFADVKSARVVVGDVLGPPELRVAQRAQWQKRVGRLVFFGTELGDEQAVPPESYVVGEQPWWRPAEWERNVLANRGLRSQIRRAAAKGVQIRKLSDAETAEGAPLREAIRALMRQWLLGRQLAPMDFLLALRPFELREFREYYVAERDGVLVGLLVSSPVFVSKARQFEHLIRDLDAPNGTAEALIDAAMRDAARAGTPEVTLGLCPLAGRVPAPLAWVRRMSRGMYDFSGLYAFKAKLQPHRWQRVLVEHPGQAAWRATLQVLRAFAGGNFLRFGMLSALRGPPPLIRAVAAVLLPWTLALACLDTGRWFPSPLVHAAWVCFDMLIAAGLFWLASRIQRRALRTWLHRTLAALITLDAFVTLAQALLWNANRAQGSADAILLAAACIAPASVSVMLWSSLSYRRRRCAEVSRTSAAMIF